MDKKNTILGITFIGLALAFMFWQGRQTENQVVDMRSIQNQEEGLIESIQEDHAAKTLGHPDSSLEHYDSGKPVSAKEVSLVKKIDAAKDVLSEKFDTKEVLSFLENDYIRVTFTNLGGAIKNVALNQYRATLDGDEPFIFNAFAKQPALGIRIGEGMDVPKEYAPPYEIVLQEKDRILFLLKSSEGIDIYRGYSLNTEADSGDPYVIVHETKFINRSQEAFDLKKLYINVGTAPATEGDRLGEYLNYGYYDGKKASFIKASKFNGSNGFLGFGKRLPSTQYSEMVFPVIWGSVKNQFFASVLTPNNPGQGIFVEPVDLQEESGQIIEGITGCVIMNLGRLSEGEERLLGMEYYVGPKEYTRLDTLGHNQDLVMQFGFFGFVSKILLVLMVGIQKVIPNWGLTIIAVTVLIKVLMWPLTAAQVKSSKRMAKIQEPMQKLREKYKDNPQKMQMETMKLFKEHKVNPAAGCLPLLVQLPIFLGFYFMLRTSSQLRFAHFLWIKDLSVPDTIAHIGGFPLNILPLIMGVTMFLQMKFAPTPTTDNMQRKIFQMMPFIFLVFCYNFPSGLVLYWTVQNLLTIVQQWVTGRGANLSNDIEMSKPKHRNSKKTLK